MEKSIFSWKNYQICKNAPTSQTCPLTRSSAHPKTNDYEGNYINTIFSQFIWNNKRPKIQFNALVKDYKYGGQKMIHLDSFCKATKLTWVQKIYKSSDDNSWKIMAREILKVRHSLYI